MGRRSDGTVVRTSRDDRRRKAIELTLSDESRAKLDKLAAARDESRSAVVEWLLARAR